jgi:toxin ParE1/3/4
MNFQLTTKAKEDLKNIAIYTQEVWGIKQRDIYLRQIDDIFHLVAKDFDKGKNCDYIKSGYRKYSAGSHIIFYRQLGKKEIQIVRILHSSMDIPNRL